MYFAAVAYTHYTSLTTAFKKRPKAKHAQLQIQVETTKEMHGLGQPHG